MLSPKVIAALLSSLPALHAAIPQIPGFTITFADDFDGNALDLPSSANWIVDTGTSYPGGPANWGTGEVQTYTSDRANLHLTGFSSLGILALKDASGGWTSARIETVRTDFMAQPGGRMRMDARIIMPSLTGPAAEGYWPAFWSLGEAFRGNYWNWPEPGEFDVMENVNGLNQVWGTLHCGVSPGGPCDETTGLSGSIACPGSACPGNAHTYSIEYDRSVSPEELRWSVDDVIFHTVFQDQVGEATWAQSVQSRKFLLLNLAIGGGFPDGVAGFRTPTANTQTGGSMNIDWVAVYNSI